MTTSFSDAKAEVARIGGLDTDNADDAASATAWTKGGLRMIGRAGAWPWLRYAISFTMVADQYAYPLSGIASDLWRLDSRSLRYGGQTSRLRWAATPESIDEQLGPAWKDASAASGTPQYATRMGADLWIANKPSQTFIDSNPTMSGYGWRHENYDEDADINSGNLLLPDEFMEVIVDASLAHGWNEEGDQRAVEMLQRWRQVHLPEMMGVKLDVGAGDRMIPPDWAYWGYTGLDDYGDGNYSH